MNKISLIILGVLLSTQVANAQVTADLMGAGMPALQAETVYDLATQGTVADDLAIGGDAITFAGAGTIASTGAGTDLTMSPVDSFIMLGQQDGNRALTWDPTTDASLFLTFGDAATAAQDFSLVSLSSDGADNDSLNIGAGGAAGSSRGANIFLGGNEYLAGDGVAQLRSGDISGAYVDISSPATNGVINLKTNGATALVISSAQAAMFTGAITSSATGALGWTVVNAANQACNTTCTSACVIGIDTLGTGGFLDCATATADSCLCAGAS